MDDICKDITKGLKKYGQIYVRDLPEKIGYSAQTINLHLKHINGKQITFQLKGKKKYYFLTPKSGNSAQKIQEATDDELAKIRGFLKKSLLYLENIDDKDSIELFSKVSKLILLEFGKIYVYKSGIEKKDFLKTWLKEEEDLKEILEKIASPKNLANRLLLESVIGMDIYKSIKEIENDIKQIEDKNNIKYLE